MSLYKKAIDLGGDKYVKYNYNKLINEINSATLCNALINTNNEAFIRYLLENNIYMRTKWEIDSVGYIIRLISYEPQIGNEAILYQNLESYLKVNKFNFLTAKLNIKYIDVGFPKFLINRYKKKYNESGLNLLKERIHFLLKTL